MTTKVLPQPKWPKGRDFDAAVPAGDLKLEMRCIGLDPDLFFPTDAYGLRVAKEICSACPVAAWCLIGATRRREPWGVWGGVLFDKGRPVSSRRSELQLVAAASVA